MQVTFILSLLREDIVRALFWTLVHSLWQGLALAILTGLVILFTRRSAPTLRYNILLGLFCLFLAAAGATFLLQLRGTGVPSGSPAAEPASFAPALPAETPVMSNLYAGDGQSWTGRLETYLSGKAGVIVAIWMIILFIRLVKLVVSLGTVQRLRYYRTNIVDEYWQQRVSELARRIGIKKVVGLLESSLIRVPMMAGVFKPVILVPLGLLSQLPPQQVEAILLHELAHIRRKDYFVNILQSIAEILFFFNPAVLWISSLIREERENCCDDIAVGETRSKKEFIHALVSFQEYKQSPNFSMAFPGNKNHLLQRVKRIVHNDNKTLNIPEKLFLLICVFITAGLTMAYHRQTPKPVKPAVGQVKMAAPVPPVKMVSADTSKPDQKREWERITQQQQAALAEQQKRLEEAQLRLAAQEKELTAQQERLNDLYAEALARMQDLRDSVHGRAPLNRLQAEQDRLLKINQRMLETQARLAERHIRENQRQTETQTRIAEQRMRENQRQMETQTRLLVQRASMSKHITPIVEMLQDKKLITRTDELSFSLDKDGLIVNGQKQPAEVFQDFKKAFLDDPQDYVRYEKKGGSESTSINKHKD